MLNNFIKFIQTLIPKNNHKKHRIPFRTLSLSAGSMTVEAALILPVFLFAMLSVVYLGLLIMCQDEVQWALTKTAREISAEYGATENEMVAGLAYCQTKMAVNLKKNIVSFHMLESSILQKEDDVDLIINYTVRVPFRIVVPGKFHFRQRVHMRAFTGVTARGETDQGNDILVYITPTGHVYHKDKKCTYLKLSISQLKYGDISSVRNESGGKYRECEHCAKGKTLTDEMAVWITNYGDRYHTYRSCSAIKREIKEIKLSEAGNRTPCTKCGKD